MPLTEIMTYAVSFAVCTLSYSSITPCSLTVTADLKHCDFCANFVLFCAVFLSHAPYRDSDVCGVIRRLYIAVFVDYTMFPDSYSGS